MEERYISRDPSEKKAKRGKQERRVLARCGEAVAKKGDSKMRISGNRASKEAGISVSSGPATSRFA